MDFNSTVKGSALEGFYPAGWDFENLASVCWSLTPTPLVDSEEDFISPS